VGRVPLPTVMPQSATVASRLDRSLDGLRTSVDEVVVETGLSTFAVDPS
jgi:hypothetical protein